MLWIFCMYTRAFGKRCMFNALLPALFIYLVHTINAGYMHSSACRYVVYL